jgi:uncharacterized heparinase superfamily protein
LEYYILGNHLLANAKALIFAGAYFQGAGSDEWYLRGLRLLEQEVSEQVLADGGHFERSPMYHHIVLEDLLDVVNVVRVRGWRLPDELPSVVAAMAEWAEAMAHSDGGIAFFNDATFRVAPDKAALRAYAVRLGLGWPEGGGSSRLLASSGYARLESGPWLALVDVASVGPDYLPGHAHADTLSLEVSMAGRRVLVNGGTSEYGVARRARVHDVRFDDQSARVEAWHDGYRRLAGGPRHWRLVQLGGGGLDIVDRVDGSGQHQAEGFFLFHPDVVVSALNEVGGFRVEINGAEPMTLRVAGADSVRLEQDATWHPEFGRALATSRLVYAVRGKLPFEVQTRLVAT